MYSLCWRARGDTRAASECWRNKWNFHVDGIGVAMGLSTGGVASSHSPLLPPLDTLGLGSANRLRDWKDKNKLIIDLTLTYSYRYPPLPTFEQFLTHIWKKNMYLMSIEITASRKGTLHKLYKGWSIFAYSFSNLHNVQIRTDPPTHPSICTDGRRKYVHQGSLNHMF